MTRAVVVGEGPADGSRQCATRAAVVRPPRFTRVTAAALFGAWRSEAQEAQAQMDGLEAEWRLGLSSADRFDTGFYYWRGRRDGYEGAAYDLGQSLWRDLAAWPP